MGQNVTYHDEGQCFHQNFNDRSVHSAHGMQGERFTKDSENQPVDGRVDPSVHGHHGKLSVVVSPTDHPFNNLMLQATKELTAEFPFTLDMNGGRPIGVGKSKICARNVW